MNYEFENIPGDLRERDQWILWGAEERDGRVTKVPKQPNGSFAKTTDPDTWSPFPLVREVYESQGSDGVGFVFCEEDPFVGIDVDDCFEAGGLTDGAWGVVEHVDSYVEISPSGGGLHIICRGSVPDFGNRTGEVPGMKELEIYGSARYFTVTGWHLEDTPSVPKRREQEVYSLCKDSFGGPEQPTTSEAKAPNDLSDEKLVEKAKAANDDGLFERLWRGDASDYESHSEAQQALANKLVFWTGGDKERMLRLFKASGMPRGQDDVRKFRDHDSETALDDCDDFFDPGGGADAGGRVPGGGDNPPEDPDLEPGPTGPGGAIRALYEEDKKQARVEASNQIKSELTPATHRESGHLYWWDEEDYTYSRGGEKVARSLLVDLLGKHFSQHEAREIIARIKPQTYRSEFGAEGFVPVANGDLKITEDGVELRDPTPERGFRNRSPARWDPDADAPLFRNFLESVVLREVDRKTLQEYAGYALLHWGLPLHKALFLVGPQAAGKSTLLEAICEALGKATHLSPHQLVGGRFGAVELEDSWANVAADISSDLLSNVGRFKEITAGDPVYVERKFEQGYTIRPTTKHFYSANQLPEIKVDDDAFFRRVLIVPFPKTVPKEERDPSLPEKLKMELDGILRWAVEGLLRLLETKEFTGDLSPSETRRLWQEHASSIGKFKVQRLNVTGRHDRDEEVKDEVFNAYTAFCEENGLSAESQSQLTRVLKRDPKIGDAERTPPGLDRQKYCYTGIKLLSEGPESPN